MLHPFLIPNLARVDKSLPTAAIDLSGAYSDPAPAGTGYAQSQWQLIPSMAKDLTQSQAAKRFVDYVDAAKDAGAPSVNLILEAPLSYCFEGRRTGSTSLNARLRAVERGKHYPQLRESNVPDRPWTVNAGASTALVAILLLRHLNISLPAGLQVNLFEGFWSWSEKPNAHHKVARALIEGFSANAADEPAHIVPLPDGADEFHYQTILDVVFPTANPTSSPPLIVYGDPVLAGLYSPSH